MQFGNQCHILYLKYMCCTPGNSLVVLATLKNPHFDPLHNFIASEIKVLFLYLILKNDPCLKMVL